jgi:spore coat polysaccharide biosynthesis protein SpsF (cytidylyltransferase family)
VRVTADNPFLDARLIDALIDARDAKGEEGAHAALVRHRGGLPLEPGSAAAASPPGRERRSPRLPVGYGVELARTASLERAARAIPTSEFHHRVHVTSWLAAHDRLLEVPTPLDWPDRGGWRWTVDTYEDLAMARSAFRVFGLEASTIDYPGMVTLLDGHPEIASMNAHIEQKALEEG